MTQFIRNYFADGTHSDILAFILNYMNEGDRPVDVMKGLLSQKEFLKLILQPARTILETPRVTYNESIMRLTERLVELWITPIFGEDQGDWNIDKAEYALKLHMMFPGNIHKSYLSYKD